MNFTSKPLNDFLRANDITLEEFKSSKPYKQKFAKALMVAISEVYRKMGKPEAPVDADEESQDFFKFRKALRNQFNIFSEIVPDSDRGGRGVIYFENSLDDVPVEFKVGLGDLTTGRLMESEANEVENLGHFLALFEAQGGMWGDKSFDDIGGSRRFQEFLKTHGHLLIGPAESKVQISTFKDWTEVKKAFGVSKGKNPTKAGLPLWDNDKEVQFSTLPRAGARTKNLAQDMEAFIQACVLVDKFPENASDEEMDNFIEDLLKNEAALNTAGVDKDELNKLVRALDDKSYAHLFLKVAGVARRLGLSPEKYSGVPRAEWEAIKKKMAKDLSNPEEKILADKWNPADVLIKANSFSLAFLLDDSKPVEERFWKFEDAVYEGDLIPISIKMTSGAIKGSRGIGTFDKGISKRDGTLEQKAQDVRSKGIPVEIIGNGKKEEALHHRVLDFLFEKRSSAVEYFERNYDLARNISDLSASYWLVNDVDITPVLSQRKSYQRSKLKRVLINTGGNQCFLDFGNDEVGVIRFKGSSLYISIEFKNLPK